MPKRKKVSISNANKKSKVDIAMQHIKIAKHLNSQIDKIAFLQNLKYVYNPTVYAIKSYESYIKKYCNSPKKVIFLGMNPGPWGMSQTGVPFGDVDMVKNWLHIEEPVQKPDEEHPARPVFGFSCQKSEVSGRRFWGLMKQICTDASTFFNNCFVYNYLPLQFISATGKNLPPTTLKQKEQEEIFSICDKALQQVIELYQIEIVVAIGKFAELRAKSALKENDVKIVCILHPSPQSKAANNWNVDAHKQLIDLDIIPYLTNGISSS